MEAIIYAVFWFCCGVVFMGCIMWPATKAKLEPKSLPRGPEFIDIVFDGPPGPESGRFVEVENPEKESISVGEWIEDGEFWRLRIPQRAAELARDSWRKANDKLPRGPEGGGHDWEPFNLDGWKCSRCPASYHAGKPGLVPSCTSPLPRPRPKEACKHGNVLRNPQGYRLVLPCGCANPPTHYLAVTDHCVKGHPQPQPN